MGWLYKQEDIRSRSRKEIVTDRMNFDSPPRSCKVLYAVERGATVYAAVQSRNEDTGMNAVVGVVVLTDIDRKGHCSFGMKVIEENMGPFHCDAPKKLINMLTPTDSERAMDWRSTCLENVRKKARQAKVATSLRALPFGTIIELTDGCGRQLEVYLYRGRKVYKFIDHWVRMPASRIAMAGYRIVSDGRDGGKEGAK